ncbi:MAG: 3-deoxy-D-manno-octulosonate 8-phosphate phosphatase [Thermoplasmata archaeon]|nr:3-deoxy-D-manno-octulosonate 8-phosphate phosphatase [Thermoplasmata archaeon]
MRIKLLVMDVDGTLTDGKIHMGQSGELFKTFDIKDGYGIYSLLKKYDIIPAIITGRFSDIVLNRCSELGITEIYQGCTDKIQPLYNLATKYNLMIDKYGIIKGCAYIGDDLIDLPCMEKCELTACPADAVQEIRSIANYVCKTNGGNGAVREFIEWIIDNND